MILPVRHGAPQAAPQSPSVGSAVLSFISLLPFYHTPPPICTPEIPRWHPQRFRRWRSRVSEMPCSAGKTAPLEPPQWERQSLADAESESDVELICIGLYLSVTGFAAFGGFLYGYDTGQSLFPHDLLPHLIHVCSGPPSAASTPAARAATDRSSFPVPHAIANRLHLGHQSDAVVARQVR